ncbi:MAG: signal recognition particle-docking protein FtsY [Gammaproteobacteria bacterium]|nr:MAG: signal recognition particle-docking protein FtsY [Gammaproteobacteria bacterium]
MVFGFGKKKKKQLKKAKKSTDKQDQSIETNGQSDSVSAESITADLIAEAEVAEVPAVEVPAVEVQAVEATKAIKPTKGEKVVERSGKAAIPQSEKKSYFSRLKAGLAKTGAGFGHLFLGKKVLDDELLEDLETVLLMADVGIESTQEIIDDITDGIARKSLKDSDAVVEQLKLTMQRILHTSDKPLVFTDEKPFVLLVVGINGAGKTTTIGKIAQKIKTEGKSVMLAAGDTFRAAAVEQLEAWGERAGVPVVSQGIGADSASVIYDAYESAKAKGVDVLIADTAGRLHTQSHLMSEIEKIVRVLRKHDSSTPHEVMLVIDAGNGQNALNQAKEFHHSLGLTGITVTKLDGTAKGGIVFPIAKQLGLPVRFIGVGESAQDLREFNATDFVNALLSDLGSTPH